MDLEQRLRAAEAALQDEQSRRMECEGRLQRICESRAYRAIEFCRELRGRVHPLRVLRRAARQARRRFRGEPPEGAAPRFAADASSQATYSDRVGRSLGVGGRVSVVLPVYNHASMLGGAIESVLAQSWPDVELIVVDDGSSDGVERVLDRYVSHPRVVLLTQPNQKLPSALNNGFAHATGEFFTWTSADNLMRPRQLERLVAFLEAHPSHVMAYSDYRIMDGRGQPVRSRAFRPEQQDPNDPSLVHLPTRVTEENLHESGENFLGASFLYRRDAARMAGLYAEETFGGEDYDYWLRLHALGDIGHVAEVLYDYRVHANTLNARAWDLGLFENVKRLLERDRARRHALRRLPRFVGVGVQCPEGGDGAEVLVWAYSRRLDSQVREGLGKASLSVCWFDGELADFDFDALANADLVLTREPRVQRLLEPTRPFDAFVLEPRAEPELFTRLVQMRAFEKAQRRAPARPAARPYRRPERLRAALQVERLHRGGLEQMVGDLARNLDRSRVELTVIVNGAERGDTGDSLLRDGVDVVVTGGQERALEKLVHERRLEIVNLHHSVSGLEVYRRAGVGMAYTVHNSYTWFSPEEAARRAESLRDVDLFLAVSRQVQRYFAGKFEVDPARIRVVPNGLDARQLSDVAPARRSDLGVREEDFVFVNIGSFNRTKHHNVLLAAMRELVRDTPNARLLMIGEPVDGEYFKECVERIARYGLSESVRVLSWRSRREIASVLRAGDAFVLPSLQEGWSIAAMEAMHAGLPLILTDTGGARDVIREGDVGALIPNPYRRIEDLTPAMVVGYSKEERPLSTAALVRAMRALASDRAKGRQLGRLATQKVMTEFSVQAMAQRYLDAFLEIRHVMSRQVRREKEAAYPRQRF